MAKHLLAFFKNHKLNKKCSNINTKSNYNIKLFELLIKYLLVVEQQAVMLR